MAENDQHKDAPIEGGSALPQGFKLTPEQAAARGKRNNAIALSLLAFVVLIFFVTYVRLTANIETRPLNESAPSIAGEETPSS